ncbi:unnamed protein product [Rhodiola kirilowii]
MSAPSGKLAFSLKPKSKLIAPPVKFGGDDEEDEIEVGNLVDRSVKKQKATQLNVLQQPSKLADVAPFAPSDPTVKKVADKLASFVAKNGRQFEHVTRQKNPGDTPFKFLFDESCADYKYYEYRLNEEERVLSRTSNNGSTIKVEQTPNGYLQKANYQIPASALYESTDSVAPGGANASSSADPVAMMEFYMKKASQEEKRKLPKHSKDEMPPPAFLQGSDKKGHHMGDYIPPEELEKFMSTCNDAAAQKASKEAAERAKIQADNVGHKLLSKMGWREGEGLGSSKWDCKSYNGGKREEGYIGSWC